MNAVLEEAIFKENVKIRYNFLCALYHIGIVSQEDIAEVWNSVTSHFQYEIVSPPW